MPLIDAENNPTHSAHVQMEIIVNNTRVKSRLMTTTCVLVCSVPEIAVTSRSHSMFSHWLPVLVWAPPKV